MVAGARITLERARRDVAGHASDGLTWPEFAEAVRGILARLVPHDGAVVATIDPASGLLTSIVRSRIDNSADELFMEIELTHQDPITLTTLAGQREGVGILADHLQGDPQSSPRVRDLLGPHFDLEHEMRAVARVGGRLLAGYGLYRAPQRPGFTADDAAALTALEDVIADGVRRSLAGSPVPRVDHDPGPGIVIVGRDGRVREATDAGRARLGHLAGARGARLGHLAGAREARLPGPLRMIAQAARTQAARTGRTVPRAAPFVRVRAGDGRWFVVSAAPLREGLGAGRIALSIEPANASQSLELDLDIHGLTDRERDVVHEVLAGNGTGEIAANLGISPYTVQDHLKSIFRKVEVSSRRALVAKLTRASLPRRVGHGPLPAPDARPRDHPSRGDTGPP